MEKDFEKQLAAQRLFQKYGEMQVVNQLNGSVLENRWQITKSLSEGAFGKIYQGLDLKKSVMGVKRPVIIKFTRNHEMNDREYRSLKDVIRYTKKAQNENPYFAGTHSKGKVIINDRVVYENDKKSSKNDIDSKIENQIWSYLVQDKLGDTMENYLFDRNEPFSEKTVLQIGIQLLDSFKMIHEAGYTYNDLKLDNVLIGDDPDLPNSKSSLFKIRLIDFGLAKKYQLENGEHIPLKKEKLFQGNLIFASVNTFNMITHSRRDDLISLCYFMLYLVDGDLAFLKRDDDENEELQGWKQEEFTRIQHLKNTLSPKTICESEEGQRLLPFVEEIFALKFEDRPDYDKLRFMLIKILLDINETPTTEYDWNVGIPQKVAVKSRKQKPSNQPVNDDNIDMSLDTSELPDEKDGDKVVQPNHVEEQQRGNQIIKHNSVNLDAKMKEMQGYSFNHNANFVAMNKVIKGDEGDMIKHLNSAMPGPITDVCSNGGMSSQSMHTDNRRRADAGEQQAKMKQQLLNLQMAQNLGQNVSGNSTQQKIGEFPNQQQLDMSTNLQQAQQLQQIQLYQQCLSQIQDPYQMQEAINQLNQLIKSGQLPCLNGQVLQPNPSGQASNFQQQMNF